MAVRIVKPNFMDVGSPNESLIQVERLVWGHFRRKKMTDKYGVFRQDVQNFMPTISNYIEHTENETNEYFSSGGSLMLAS